MPFIKRITSNLFRLYVNTTGANLIEYALLAALIAVASLAALQLVGVDIICLFKQLIGWITNSAAGSCSSGGGGNGGNAGFR